MFSLLIFPIPSSQTKFPRPKRKLAISKKGWTPWRTTLIQRKKNSWVYHLHSWVFLALNRGCSPLRSSFFEDHGLFLRPRLLFLGTGNSIWNYISNTNISNWFQVFSLLIFPIPSSQTNSLGRRGSSRSAKKDERSGERPRFNTRKTHERKWYTRGERQSPSSCKLI